MTQKLLINLIFFLVVTNSTHAIANTNDALTQYIHFLAKEHNIPINIINNLIERESAYRNHVVSSAGAIGLTQLMPRTAKAIANKHGIPYHENQLKDPFYSVTLCVLHLKDLKQKYHNWHTVLTAYNRGEAGMKKYKKRHNTTVSSYSKSIINKKESGENNDLLYPSIQKRMGRIPSEDRPIPQQPKEQE